MCAVAPEAPRRTVADPEASLDAMRRSLCQAMWYSYFGTVYANPHAVTRIGNGLSTTTYAHDNNGNLISAGNVFIASPENCQHARLNSHACDRVWAPIRVAHAVANGFEDLVPNRLFLKRNKLVEALPVLYRLHAPKLLYDGRGYDDSQLKEQRHPNR